MTERRDNRPPTRLRLAIDHALAVIGFKPSAALIEEAVADTMQRDPLSPYELHPVLAYLELGVPLSRHTLQRIGATIRALRNTIEADRPKPELRANDMGRYVLLRDPHCTWCDQPLSAHERGPRPDHDFRHTWSVPAEKLSAGATYSDVET